MARQTIPLPASTFDATPVPGQVEWNFGRTSRPQLASDFQSGTDARYLDTVRFQATGRVALFFTDNQTSNDPNPRADLSGTFESDGGIQIEAGGQNLAVVLAGADMIEPYSWVPTNSAEVTAFVNVLVGEDDGSTAAILTIFDVQIPVMAFNTFTAAEWSYSHPTQGVLEVAQAAYNDVTLL